MEHAIAALATARRVIVFTGAGISCNAPANIPTYEQSGLEWTREMIDKQTPEYLAFKALAAAAQPTATHHFCARLHALGKLKRVYTQNIDGLHERVLPADMVVAVHGNIQFNKVVCKDERPFIMLPTLMGSLKADFDNQNHEERADLCLVMGTRLNVFPFSAFPNLVSPRACRRFFINVDITSIQDDSLRRPTDSLGGRIGGGSTVIKIGKHPISSEVDWCSTRSKFAKRQWLIAMDCDMFCTVLLGTIVDT
jgi:NAD-dependent SIR2 family protein deacetylase